MLSVVIATLADQGSLLACLDSLAGQLQPPPFNVVIVDQNVDDRVGAILPAFAGRLAVRHERVGFRGASRARNQGASIAGGDWLVFPDDDCVLAPDALSTFAQLRASHPGLKLITGRTVDENGTPNIIRWPGAEQLFGRSNMFSMVTEATLFVEAAAFAAVGGFDERFGPGTRFPAAEGLDLVTRLFDAGCDGLALYTPAISMQHPTKVPPFTALAAQRFHHFAIGEGALIAKCPEAHILVWGLRSCAGAAVRAFSLPPWRGAAFAARLAGLVRGYVRYRLDRPRGG